MTTLAAERRRWAAWRDTRGVRAGELLAWLDNAGEHRPAASARSARPDPPAGQRVLARRWSPDGSAAVLAAVGADVAPDLYLDVRAGGRFKLPLTMAADLSAVWRPDSRAVLIASDGGAALLAIRADGPPESPRWLYREGRSTHHVTVRATADSRYAMVVSVAWHGREYRVMAWGACAPRLWRIPAAERWVVAQVHRGCLHVTAEHGRSAYWRQHPLGADAAIGPGTDPVELPGCRAVDTVVPYEDRVLVFGRDVCGSALWMVNPRDATAVRMAPPGESRWGHYEPALGRPRPSFGYSSLREPYRIIDIETAAQAQPAEPSTTGQSRSRTAGAAALAWQPRRDFRIAARSADSTEIPVTVCLPAGAKAAAPLLLLAYGCYGIPLPLTHAWTRDLLLREGIGLAVAHVRGGGDFGRDWHTSAAGATKPRSVDDLLAVAETLASRAITCPERLAIRTFSAGAMILAAALRRKPGLCRAVVLDAPHLAPRSDPADIAEFGDAADAEISAAHDGWLPLGKLGRGAYPSVLVNAGGLDDTVLLAPALSLVAEIRAKTTATDRVQLVRFESERNHAGAFGISAANAALADIYNFIIDQVTGHVVSGHGHA